MQEQVYLDKSKKLKWGEIVDLKSIPSLLKQGKLIGYQYKGKTKIFDIDNFPNSLSMDMIMNIEWKLVEHEDDFILNTSIENNEIKLQLYKERLNNSNLKSSKPEIYHYLKSLIEICDISMKDDFRVKFWEVWSDNYSNCGLCCKSFEKLRLKFDETCICPWDKRGMKKDQNFNSGCYYTCMLFNKSQRVKGMNKNLKIFVKEYSMKFMEKQFKKLVVD